MSYFWEEGYPVTVQTNSEGHPLTLSWDWYPGLQHVWLIADRWAIDDDWWVDRKKRTYYQVFTQEGQGIILFRDDINQNWYVQWLHD